MRIKVEKNVVEFFPENETEAKELETLWRIVVDCAKFNKKLVAIGEYLPGQSECARFVIED